VKEFLLMPSRLLGKRWRMLSLSLAEIAKAISGEIYRGDPNKEVSGKVETDSRQITAGGIFFAKLGAFEDGHEYVADAHASGAVLAVVSRPLPGVAIDQIVVSDTVLALSKLAEDVLNRVRAKGKLKVVGITGSNGKTSTKNMLERILSSKSETVSPIASFNNEVGLPLTVLRITDATEYLVLELGAAGIGSIDRLANWTKPDIGVQLKVGMAHAGEFGGIEVTERIKAEMMPHIQQATVLNFDDPRVRRFEFAGKRIGFGFAEDADFRLLSTELSLEGTQVKFEHAGRAHDITLKILGEHQAMNLMAAIAVATELGVPIEQSLDIAREIEMAERWRMQLLHSPNGYWVINDAYNASPDSMRAALQTLAVLGKAGHRTIAVLGMMAELGEFSAEEHDAIGRLVVRLNIDQLFVVGQEAKLIHMAASQEGSWDGESVFIESIAGAYEIIRDRLRPEDIVLVKASNIAGLRFLGDDLAGVN
jgi:UDP-N-acetylmuramoyl-tripeptide--D-alanyl-D-alanine ligase